MLLRHPRPPGLLRPAVRAGRVRPGGPRARLRQGHEAGSGSDQGTRGEDDGALRDGHREVQEAPGVLLQDLPSEPLPGSRIVH